MFKSKFVRQENLKDCGAACLLMIIRYYGGNYPMEKLISMIKIDKTGSKASNIIEASKEIGFDARGYKCDDLNNIECPVIAHIIIDKVYHHFVVIKKIDIENKIVIIADPAFGIKKYSFDEFKSIWTNIILSFIPNRKIENINTFLNVRKKLYQIIKPYKKIFIYIFILSFFYTLLNTLSVFYYKLIIDDKYLSKDKIISLLLFLSLITIIMLLTDYIRNKLLINMNKKIDINLTSDTIKHLFSLPFNYFNSRTTGDIISRIRDLSYVKELISRLAIILLIDMVLIIGSLIVMSLININLFLIIILIFIVYFSIFLFNNNKIKHYMINTQEKDAMINEIMIESIRGINTIKNLGIEKEIYYKAMNKYNDYIDNGYQFNNKYNKIKLLKDSTINIGMLLIMLIGGLLIVEDKLSISLFIVFIFFAQYFFEPMRNILEISPLLSASYNALYRISDFYDIKGEEYSKEEVLNKGNILLNNVSYSYNNKDKVINNINLEIKSGEKVLIGGFSGIGKTTISKILMKYLNVEDNQVMLNNKDINDYSLGVIRHSICYVSQEEVLFNDSLYNNLVLDRNINKDELDKVLNMVYINDILKRHKKDYYMLLEENGSNISAGERQRLIIGRSLFKNSQIYIFDESLSNLSVSIERNILKNIFNEYRDKTIIVISHRLNNTDLYDRVIMFENIIGKE